MRRLRLVSRLLSSQRPSRTSKYLWPLFVLVSPLTLAAQLARIQVRKIRNNQIDNWMSSNWIWIWRASDHHRHWRRPVLSSTMMVERRVRNCDDVSHTDNASASMFALCPEPLGKQKKRAKLNLIVRLRFLFGSVCFDLHPLSQWKSKSFRFAFHAFVLIRIHRLQVCRTSSLFIHLLKQNRSIVSILHFKRFDSFHFCSAFPSPPICRVIRSSELYFFD